MCGQYVYVMGGRLCGQYIYVRGEGVWSVRLCEGGGCVVSTSM